MHIRACIWSFFISVCTVNLEAQVADSIMSRNIINVSFGIHSLIAPVSKQIDPGNYYGIGLGYARKLNKREKIFNTYLKSEFEYYIIQFNNDYSFGSIIQRDVKGGLLKCGIQSSIGRWMVQPKIEILPFIGLVDQNSPRPLWLGSDFNMGLKVSITPKLSAGLENVFRFSHRDIKTFFNAFRFENKLLRLNFSYGF